MIQVITEALHACRITTYFIVQTRKTSAQLFFIRRDLDTVRSTDVTQYAVTVYRDMERDGKTLTGSASCVIAEGMDAEEIRQRLEQAYETCTYSANPAYCFAPGIQEQRPATATALAAMPLEEAARTFAEALFRNDTQDDPYINSAEIFAERKEQRIVGGNGCDVSFVICEVKGEYIVQCRKKNDVEMYHDFQYDELDTDDLADRVKEALETVVFRSVAEKTTPRGNYTVILSDKSVAEIMAYYSDRADASLIYPKYSDFTKGMDVMEGATGDRITMKMVAKEPFSNEGVPIVDRVLLDNGILKTILGNTRLCSYLGEEPTGVYRAAEVQNGSMPLADMIQERTLQLVSFSDFQMNAMSGYFGGEIRLAYLYEKGEKIPVTGGSINGNFIQLQKNMRLSRETQKSGSFTGPKHLLFFNVPVSGE